ncbi:multidrug resistance protein mdtg [Anaeramoeba flamelloides]|uniref:Multidrug resistance protein mdtg n=1 Tax=Anaeramoeba flamelloides TaxID=1746091 RepID=A0AAV7YTT0_9EUKA|nr:multidrug resistance protein mdtg [Anaeramoeba flamelloides]
MSQKKDLALIYLTQCMNTLSLSGIMTLLPLAVRDYGASPGMIGFVLGSFSITELIGNFVLGWLSDRKGRISILYFSAIFLSISLTCTALVEEVYWVLIFRMITGFFAGIQSVGQAAVSDYASTQKESNDLMSRVILSLSTGYVLGPLIIFVLSFFPIKFKWICFVLGCIIFILIVPFIFINPNTKKFEKPKKYSNDKTTENKEENEEILNDQNTEELDRKPEVNKKEIDDADTRIKSSSNEECDQEILKSDERAPLTKKGWKRFLTKDLILMFACHYLIAATYYVIDCTVPLAIQDKFKKDPETYSSITYTLHGLVAAGSCIKFVPYMSNNVGERKSFKICTIVMVAMCMLWPWIPNYWVYTAIYSLYALFLVQDITLASSLILHIAPLGEEGKTMGIAQLLQASGKSITPIYGLLIYTASYHWFFVYSASFWLLLYIIFSFTDMAKVEKKIKKDDQNKNGELNTEHVSTDRNTEEEDQQL